MQEMQDLGILVRRVSGLAMYASCMVAFALRQDFDPLVIEYLNKPRLLRRAEVRAVAALRVDDSELADRLDAWLTRYEALTRERNRVVHSIGLGSMTGQFSNYWHPRSLGQWTATPEALRELNDEASDLVHSGFYLAEDVEFAVTGERTLSRGINDGDV